MRFRTGIERVYAVVPQLAPVSTAEIVVRYAIRFNDRGEDFEDLVSDVRQSVERNLRRLREHGSVSGPPWIRLKKP